jgi:hypothetical protein
LVSLSAGDYARPVREGLPALRLRGRATSGRWRIARVHKLHQILIARRARAGSRCRAAAGLRSGLRSLLRARLRCARLPRRLRAVRWEAGICAVRGERAIVRAHREVVRHRFALGL